MNTLLRTVRPLALLLLAVALHGCAIWPTGPVARERRELERSRRLWESQQITGYRYRLQVFSFLPDEFRGPVLVEVRNRSTVSVTYVSSGAPARAQPFGSMDTVEELFDTISRALDRDPDEVEVEYDPQLGYPRHARFDFEKNATDEEGGFEVTSFQR